MIPKSVETVVKTLLSYEIARSIKYDKFREAGIEVSAFDNENPAELAFDLMGFPADNSSEFQHISINSKALRTDEENLFCRDYLNEIVCPFGQQNLPQDVEEVYQKLLAESEQTRLEAPHLFMHIS
jgi:hypothetical protein